MLTCIHVVHSHFWFQSPLVSACVSVPCTVLLSLCHRALHGATQPVFLEVIYHGYFGRAANVPSG